MMSTLGRWVAATTGMAAARPRATRSRNRATNCRCCCSVPKVAEYRAISSKIEVMTLMPSPGSTLRRRWARSQAYRLSITFCSRSKVMMAWSRSGPTNSSAMSSQ